MKKDKKVTKEIIDRAAERLAEIFIKQIESGRGLKEKKPIL